jgi:hypothetical protein
MSLRRRKRTSSRCAALAAVIGVLVLASLAGTPDAAPGARELRLNAPLSEAARADLAALAQAAGGLVIVGDGGQLVIRLDGAGALPQSLLDWARRCGVPLPRPTTGATIGSAEAVFCAKDSPTAAATVAAGPALTGWVDMASSPAWRPVEHLLNEPCLPPLVLAEHLAGRSPPERLIG